MSQLPYILDESVSRETLMRDVAPQLEQILRPEQRALLAEIDSSEQLVEFETMSREERTRYMFEAARGLVHPSKQEWLNRVESMTR